MSEATPEKETPNQAKAALVEIQPGIAAVVSDEPVKGLETLTFDLLPQGTQANVTHSVADALAGVTVAGAALGNTVNIEGLVRLTPETIAKLATLSPLQSAGENLGVLVNSSCRVASQIRWVPLSEAEQVALMASKINPVVGLTMTVAVQVASISRRLDENLELTRQAINEIRQMSQEDRWATLLSLDAAISKTVEEAHYVETVTNSVFAPVL